MDPINADFWNDRWSKGETGWDLGTISPEMKDFFLNFHDKNMKILIPGCGNAHEAAFLHSAGFKNVYILDISELPLARFAAANPDFPKNHLIRQDFFEIKDKFDLIIEQTFFCAIDPALREKYCVKMRELLSPSGKLCGLLFNRTFEAAGPPFGGSESEYRVLFEKYFSVVKIRPALNSAGPRAGTEVFIECTV